MRLLLASQISTKSNDLDAERTKKHLREKIYKVAEEILINTKELNLLAREVVSREDWNDIGQLRQGELRKVFEYLRRNQTELERRYRKIRWTE